MNLPNQITLLRLFLVPFFITSLLYWKDNFREAYPVTASLVVVACLTDLLDGFFAKKFNQRTRLGSFLDPIADKALLLSAFVAFAFFNAIPQVFSIPIWLTMLVLSKDLFVFIGLALIFVLTNKLEVKVDVFGKISTALQMLLIMLLVLQFDRDFLDLLIFVVAFSTSLSMVLYFRTGLKLLSNDSK